MSKQCRVTNNDSGFIKTEWKSMRGFFSVIEMNFDCNFCSMTVYICRNSSSCILEICAAYCTQVFYNKISKNRLILWWKRSTFLVFHYEALETSRENYSFLC